jgi:hypothetical protein
VVVAGVVVRVGGGVGLALGAGGGLPDEPGPCGRAAVGVPPPAPAGVAPPGVVTVRAAPLRDADNAPVVAEALPLPGAGGPPAAGAGRWMMMTVTGCVVVVVDTVGAGGTATGVAAGVVSFAASAATMANIAAALSPLVTTRLASAA